MVIAYTSKPFRSFLSTARILHDRIRPRSRTPHATRSGLSRGAPEGAPQHDYDPHASTHRQYSVRTELNAPDGQATDRSYGWLCATAAAVAGIVAMHSKLLCRSIPARVKVHRVASMDPVEVLSAIAPRLGPDDFAEAAQVFSRHEHCNPS